MSKTASIVVYVVIFVLALFFCVGSCLPGGLELGEYNIYNSAINLIQGDGMFSDVQQTAYKVKLDEDAKIEDVAATIRTRLGDMFGYYFSKVTVDGNNIIVNVPVTANEEEASATSILSTVTTTGKVEILTDSTYSADKVILTSDHVARTSTRRYSSSSQVYYIVNIRLNAEGQKIASEKLSASASNWSAFLAIDGSVAYGIAYGTDGNLQVYTSSNQDCDILKGFIHSGALNASLVEIPVDLSAETNIVKSNVGMIFAIAMAALFVISWIVYLVRYGKIAWAVVLSQLIAVAAFIMFAGYVYFNLLNIASAIGILLGFALMSVFTVLVLEKIKLYSDDKTFAAARYKGFKENNKWNLIVHLIVLVLGIVLWLIPTGVTAPLGNALVYTAVLSFAVTMGLNRLFTALVGSWN